MYKWGFIYTLDDDSEAIRVDTIGTMICVGVPTVDDAAVEARKLVEHGAKLIELCGAFGGPGLAAVISAVGNRVPVGAVFYGADASMGLQRILGHESGAVE
jgi:hypothetical protein